MAKPHKPVSPRLKVLLDEGVPAQIGQVFINHGHTLIPFDDVVKRGSNDVLVCAAAAANNAVLVAFDHDMKQLARGLGVGRERFKRLNLIKFECKKPSGASRLQQAMSFIEHEWHVSTGKLGRRLFVSIGTHVIRTHR